MLKTDKITERESYSAYGEKCKAEAKSEVYGK